MALLLAAPEELFVGRRWMVAVGRRRRVRAHRVRGGCLTRVGRGQGRRHGAAGVTVALHARLLGDCWRNHEQGLSMCDNSSSSSL